MRRIGAGTSNCSNGQAEPVPTATRFNVSLALEPPAAVLFRETDLRVIEWWFRRCRSRFRADRNRTSSAHFDLGQASLRSICLLAKDVDFFQPKRIYSAKSNCCGVCVCALCA